VIVLDASAALEVLLGSGPGRALAARIDDPTVTLHAPHLLAVEVTQVLRRQTSLGNLTAARAGDAVADLAALDLVRYEHEPFLPRIWALRDNLTAYDAVYVALAETLDAPLVTLDRRVADAPGHRARVELIHA
jgi:predicted nucleic acid-binding protein